MKNKNVSVSVITPAFNSAPFIKDTIESVRAQTYKNWEMIVVDDASKDSTCQIIEQWARKDERISLLRLSQNKGPAESRNSGIKAAKGRYIAFLDSDDIWLPDKLSLQIKFMQKHKCALSYTAYRKIDKDGNPISNTIKVPEIVTYKKLLSSNFIACLTAMYDSKILGKVYMPDILKRQDYCLWLKILKMGYEAYGLNECLSLYRVRSNSVSRNKIKAASYQWEIYRELEKLPLRKSISCFVKYAYFGYKKSRM
ncbi:MAG: glycosyltransferase family 2 protein [Planctomycetes bacterium]|nr:glycosyltransferase family 2 protein [Planctomycetota bacterium]